MDLFATLGYHFSYFHSTTAEGKNGYAGVGFISRFPPNSVKYGFPHHDQLQEEARVITADFDNVTIVTHYTPMSGMQNEAKDKREAFEKDLWDYTKALDQAGKPWIEISDHNVCANPPTDCYGFAWDKRKWDLPGVRDDEVAALKVRTSVFNLTDAISTRDKPPTTIGSWWRTPKKKIVDRNFMRLDYIFVSSHLRNCIISADHVFPTEGSDHIAIRATIDVSKAEGAIKTDPTTTHD
jgi:exodeoxyribonuclease-3